MADRMMESLGSAAQLTFHGEADATHLLALRAGWKRDGRVAGVEDCVIVALARALAAPPDLNGIAGKDEITLFEAVHIAMAIAAPNGLKTPVIRDACTKHVKAVAPESKVFVARALPRHTQASETKG